MMEQVNCMLAPLYSDSLNMITSVKVKVKVLPVLRKVQLFSKEEIHLEEQASALEQLKSLTHKKNFFRLTLVTRTFINAYFCRFLVTFITSTFNISSFCIALYLSISLLENLHIESGTRCLILILGNIEAQGISPLSSFSFPRYMGSMRPSIRYICCS